MDEIEDITLEEYKEWVAYFAIVDGVEGDVGHTQPHTGGSVSRRGQRPEQSQSRNKSGSR